MLKTHRRLILFVTSDGVAAGAVEMSTKRGSSTSVVASSPANERCPSCERQFGPKAFDRHVEWCRERRSRIQKSPASLIVAKERLEARIKYKVPPLRPNKRTLTREKYAAGPAANSDPATVRSVSSVGLHPERGTIVRKPKSVGDVARTDCPLKKEEVAPKVEHIEKRFASDLSAVNFDIGAVGRKESGSHRITITFTYFHSPYFGPARLFPS